VHFHDPAFREDALRGISRTVSHINDLISRLSLLRQELKIMPVEADLNELAAGTLNSLDAVPNVRLVTDFRPLPRLQVDPEQLRKVVTNLVLNAREALVSNGEVRVETSLENSWAVLRVSDNGCGMSRDFIDRSLFRPFQTTKKKGIGIGMFQSRMIVEAHRGRIEVESEPGKGTAFRVCLPLPSTAHS
jgi:signal transduction histidine kinase